MTQYKHVVSAGCSFIHGSELGDEVPFSQSTYPALVAKQLDASYDCLAYPSASNQGIAKNILEHNPAHNTVYIVQWTYPSRFGVNLNFQIKDKNKKKTTWFDLAPNSWDYDPKAFDEYTKYSKQLIDMGIPELSEQYYKYTGNNDQFMFQTELCIKAVQQHCREHEAGFLFYTATSELLELQDVNGFDRKGFVEWALDSKYAHGPYKHPLHEAHFDAASYVAARLRG